MVKTLEQRRGDLRRGDRGGARGRIVVFSAHGVSPAVHQEAALRSLRTIDATCPLVTKVHNEAKRFASQDYDILLIAPRGPRGGRGHRGRWRPTTSSSSTACTRRHRAGQGSERLVWLAQTTLSVDETTETVSGSRSASPHLIDPRATTSATQNRQVAVKEIAAQAQLVIVVGSENSSTPSGWSRSPSTTGPTPPTWSKRRLAHRRRLARRRRHGGVTSGASVPRTRRRCPGPAWRATVSRTSRRIGVRPRERSRSRAPARAAQGPARHGLSLITRSERQAPHPEESRF
ncbi:4-hydroxy-3-methylbut-2-enyl diphosphate reductase [Streptosporangium vulgare]|uniref:4-hydroxy-3-methylbut-2-enyl diphosphate reductase n=1 Tax=Streptosporangium vulgare TaxID=46190 RepID=UPI0031E3BCBD